MDGGFPISVLNAIKAAPTVCRVYCATANPTTVLLASFDKNKKGIFGVIDGMTSLAIEDERIRKQGKIF
jgi:adenosine/AMP kinase